VTATICWHKLASTRVMKQHKIYLALCEGHKFGWASLVCGVVTSVLFFVLAYLPRLGQRRTGFILQLLDQIGVVNKERSYIVELKASSIFSLNDANAIVWLTWCTFVIAIAAVVLALYAEYKSEATLNSSAGFAIATISIALLYPLAMLLVQLTGVLVLLHIRTGRLQFRSKLKTRNSS
jgi:hypothetical protein